MAEADLIDPLTMARARAQLALRADAWPSFKVATSATLAVTGATVAVVGVSVAAKLLQSWMLPWLLGSAAFGSFLLTYSVLEARRIYERAVALTDLFNTVKQYEVLILDARSERNQYREQVSSLTLENNVLKNAILQLSPAAPNVQQEGRQ